MRQVLAGLCLLASVVSAQEFRATISGRVTDTQEAAVSGVKIIAVGATLAM